MKDVRAMSVKKAGDTSDDSFFIGAVDQQNGRIRHDSFIFAHESIMHAKNTVVIMDKMLVDIRLGW